MTDRRERKDFRWRALEERGHDRRQANARGAREGNPFAGLIILAMIAVALIALLSDTGAGALLRTLGRLL